KTNESNASGRNGLWSFTNQFSPTPAKTFHTDLPDLSECFQLSVLAWLPCVFLWVASPAYIYYLKKSSRGYIMMSLLNRFKTVSGTLSH
uniref:Uncharacterized protein n=1 Tax=Poecilia mexicana TaxID=48701 RepID=A0A3B3Y3J0_9TELE